MIFQWWHILLAAFIGGFTSAVASRVFEYRRGVKAERERVSRLLLNEFAYWSDCDEKAGADADGGIYIGAISAVSNVLAAVNGHPAPWHQDKPINIELEVAP